MSLQGLTELDVDWFLRNTLTIDNDVVVNGDLNTTGFIYDGGVPVNLQASNNIWTGENTFTNYPPTYIAPTQPTTMATKNYMDTALTGLGSSYLASNNTWTGANSMQDLPDITNSANAGNECVNKSVCDSIIGASTGNLATTNVWTGTNAFSNTLSVATPLTDAQIGNKQYVDNAISTFNSVGGKVEIFETIGTGSISITLDPSIYSSMLVCMVSSGGYGNANTTPTGATIKSFGGSGAMVAFYMSAFNGNCVYTATNNTPTSVGTSTFSNPSPISIVSLTGGGNGSSSASGAGGTITLLNGATGVQTTGGSTQTLQNPPVSGIDKVTNICCFNGMGCGGSFNFQTGASVNPTGSYLMIIKFKN